MSKVTTVIIDHAGLHASSRHTKSLYLEVGPTCSYTSKLCNHIHGALMLEFPGTSFRLVMNRNTYICYNIPDNLVQTDALWISQISMFFEAESIRYSNKLLLDNPEQCNLEDHG